MNYTNALTALILVAAPAIGLSSATAAFAQSYDIANHTGSSVFEYGQGDSTIYANGSAASFIPFTNSFSCGGGMLQCQNNVAPYPYIARNPTVSDFVNEPDYTLKSNQILLQTGDAAGKDSAVIRFSPSAANLYQLAGLFVRLENPFQDGTLVSIYKVSGATATSLYSQPLPSGAQYSSKSFNLSTSLSAGDSLDFLVSANGTNFGDTTALQGLIQVGAVPEPSTWAMMLVGFGFAGGRMRSARRRKTAVGAVSLIANRLR